MHENDDGVQKLSIKVDKQLYESFSEIMKREGLKKLYMIEKLLEEKLREFVEGEL